MASLVDGFSLLAIATSYIGFILGLTDFLSDLLQVRKQVFGDGRQRADDTWFQLAAHCGR